MRSKRPGTSVERGRGAHRRRRRASRPEVGRGRRVGQREVLALEGPAGQQRDVAAVLRLDDPGAALRSDRVGDRAGVGVQAGAEHERRARAQHVDLLPARCR